MHTVLLCAKPQLFYTCFFFVAVYCACISGLVTKSRVSLESLHPKSEGGCASHPSASSSIVCFFFLLCVCVHISIRAYYMPMCVCFFVFFASSVPHFAPICFMLAVRSHLCQCFIPSVRVSAWVPLCECEFKDSSL